MELFTRDEFEKLGKIREKLCASVYINTHESGMEVNEGIDRIAFKNEIQKINSELEKRKYKNTNIFLKPAFDLIENTKFWKNQSKGLAVFITENSFLKYRVPISFNTNSYLSTAFELVPLLPLLVENDSFLTLALSQQKIRLFRNTTYSSKIIDISHSVPENIDEILSYYEFEKSAEGKNLDFGRQKGAGGALAVHGYNMEDGKYLYLYEFVKEVNDGVIQTIKNEHIPLVVASVDKVFGLYQEVNTYKHLMPQGVMGNPDYLSEKELHKKSYAIVKEILSRPRNKDIEKIYGIGRKRKNILRSGCHLSSRL